ncbi:hypothetical protein SEEN953_05636 [Salmonella enterica subsp. enterica serovar Newport str. CVM 33953]|nr:hypothetical protein [Salmonella enterica]EBF2878262.1 hypothetical protein [Salmonella enterica subsp. enterica serovar Newport]EJA09693.1 hypothetical protein SEEN953_05636 [Salmonella enterica subsp. enterica serovar Newport str. CVM 33953]EAM4539407.1 hypothetical protein [Salmonella enterica]EAM5411989.1 hypothetical protein [Salmonella enterica]
MFFLPRENEVPGYCNVFLALFYGNLSNLERDREIKGWESICSSIWIPPRKTINPLSMGYLKHLQ